jgi:hypothetical protein
VVAVIWVTCEECGDVELRSRDLLLHVPEDRPGGTYSFRCPTCGRRSVRQAEASVVEVLAATGVRVKHWRAPAELAEPRPGGAAFSADDLLAFHELLHDESRLPAALSGLASL